METLLIIGIDGGATKVSAWETIFDNESKCFSLGALNAEKKYSDIPGYIENFKPVDIKTQLDQREANPIPVTSDEEQQESVYVEACAKVVEEIVSKRKAKQVLIGLGMPGLKTEDQRGIAVVANGPRMINYSAMLEDRLKAAGIELIAPIDHLGSDADYCGIGENYSKTGAFRKLQNAYYLGGGTGVADALKLEGHLIPLDDTKEWFAKTWEMKSDQGLSLERYCSAGGIQSLYAQLTGIDVAELTKTAVFPPQIAQKAIAGEEAAAKTFETLVNNLALLLYARITTLFSGWDNAFEFMNPARPALNPDHKFRNAIFDKIVIGQRLGDLYHAEENHPVFKEPLLKKLSAMLEKDQKLSEAAKAHYSNIETIITTSQLREAPALGAGIDAFFSWQD